MGNWKTLESKVGYQTKWLTITEDKVLRPDGKEGLYSYISSNDGLVVIPFDEKKSTISFIKEYRYPVKSTLLTLPCATIPKGADIVENSVRELAEETGLRSQKMAKIGEFYKTPADADTLVHVMLATEFSKSWRKEDDDAQIEKELFRYTLDEISKLISENSIKCSYTLSSLNIFLNLLKNGKLENT